MRTVDAGIATLAPSDREVRESTLACVPLLKATIAAAAVVAVLLLMVVGRSTYLTRSRVEGNFSERSAGQPLSVGVIYKRRPPPLRTRWRVRLVSERASVHGVSRLTAAHITAMRGGDWGPARKVTVEETQERARARGGER